MSVTFNYVPPKLDAAVIVRGAAEHAVEAAAQAILDASQELVPVDTGALKASGHVVKEDGLSAAIVYGQQDGAGRNGQDTAKYAVRQHEELDYHHEVGQAKYLETALHAEGEHVAEVIATTLRNALG